MDNSYGANVGRVCVNVHEDFGENDYVHDQDERQPGTQVLRSSSPAVLNATVVRPRLSSYEPDFRTDWLSGQDNRGHFISPETLAAIAEYLNTSCTATCADKADHNTQKSSDSNKENWDPDSVVAEPYLTIPSQTAGHVAKVPSIEEALVPPAFDMTLSVSEILFDDPPSFRVLLNTSTVRQGQYSHNSHGGYSDAGTSWFATQNMPIQVSGPASLRYSAVTGKLDTFLAAEFVKRPLLKNRKLSLALHLQNKGYTGGDILRGDICLKVKRLCEGEFVEAQKIELTTVCVEAVGSHNHIVESLKLYIREDVKFTNAGMNILRFETKLPEYFGPGYFHSSRASIRYIIFVSANVSLKGRNYMLRAGEDIKYFQKAADLLGDSPLSVIPDVRANGTIWFGGAGKIFLTVQAAQDKFEAGQYCYLRVTIGNTSTKAVTKMKLKLVQHVEYLELVRRKGVDRCVMAKAVSMASREGWPIVESRKSASYTCAVKLPKYSTSIISTGFRVSYAVDVSVGGYLGQYITASYPIKILYRSDAAESLVTGPIDSIILGQERNVIDSTVLFHNHVNEFGSGSQTVESKRASIKKGTKVSRPSFVAFKYGRETKFNAPVHPMRLQRDLHFGHRGDGFTTMQSMRPGQLDRPIVDSFLLYQRLRKEADAQNQGSDESENLIDLQEALDSDVSVCVPSKATVANDIQNSSIDKPDSCFV
ncbi:hypothetical protein V1512DRAFT_261325 [Lipomyces arxii]|uniref:uncharacterized protein n=1 Tax=Lipomyces arxii TaxID=56418 RepID=UPI0034CD99FC